MEMTQEWTTQFNKKCSEFLSLHRDEEVAIYNMTAYTYDMMKFHSDWNWIMEVVEKIQYYRACIISNNHCEIHMMRTDNITSINIGARSTQLATIQAIDQFIDWYNKQKEL